jgi:hypothetical protein
MSADINLDNIHADLALSGNLDLGLDDVGVSVHGGVDIGLGTIAATLSQGIRAAVDLGLDNVRAAVDAGLNEIRIKELPLIRSESELDLGLDNIRIAQLPPIQLEVAVRPTRVHLPLSYAFSIELFGIKVFKFSLCGEGMVISEDYKPHATERCA